jgi:uncharacterized protein
MKIDVAGETLELLPDRAAFWERARILLVADPHFGKAASFRSAGVFVPEQTTDATLARLDALLQGTRATRLVFLGDFLHAREGRHPRTIDALNTWRRVHAGVTMTLVRGNHDAKAGDPPRELDIECVTAPLLMPPFAFVHHPKRVAEHYAVGGHIHPGAVLGGKGRQKLFLPCFWFGAEVGVLPAFGEFTGLAEISVSASDRVWIVADGEVLPAS